ncbi:MAG TPA: hypothetical protein VM638_01250, partial [Actinomycetota bacterium]|nr:hypothetical protein [Actinomycetota bacterium]
NNITTCQNVATLQGTFAPAAGTISVTVPRAVLAQQLGSSLAGARVIPASPAICEGISVKLSPYVSLCGGSAGSQTGDTILQNDEDVYRFASPSVQVGIVPAGAAPAYTQPGTVGGSPTGYSATLDTSNLAPGQYDVHVRACYGTNCGTAVRQVTL